MSSSSWVSKNAYVLIGVGLAVVVAAVGIASLARAVSGNKIFLENLITFIDSLTNSFFLRISSLSLLILIIRTMKRKRSLPLRLLQLLHQL